MDDEPVDSLWVRIIGQTKTSNVVVSVCYQPPDQEEILDFVAFFRQLE